jgi:cadmium resistance protein CadD (predicted permease)
MITDRFLGLLFLVFGCSLLLFFIPNYVTAKPGNPLDPSLFPRVAGWIIASLGLLQVIFARPNSPRPALSEFLGFMAFIVALIIAAWLLPKLGFIPVAIGLMVACLILVRERRPLWALLTLLAVPSFVWFLFAILLQRPLS